MLVEVIIYATDGLVSKNRAVQLMAHRSVLVGYSFYNIFSIAGRWKNWNGFGSNNGLIKTAAQPFRVSFHSPPKS
jgi:hypothetical protein